MLGQRLGDAELGNILGTDAKVVGLTEGTYVPEPLDGKEVAIVITELGNIVGIPEVAEG